MEHQEVQELVQGCPCIPGSNWNVDMLIFEDGAPSHSTYWCGTLKNPHTVRKE